DYAVNAGGVMNVSLEIDGYNRERAMRLIRSIYYNVAKIFDLSERENIGPQYAADRIAEARLAAIGKLKLPMGLATPRLRHLRGEQHGVVIGEWWLVGGDWSLVMGSAGVVC